MNKDGEYNKWRKAPVKPIVMSHESNLRVLYEDNHLIAVNKRNSDIIQSDKSGDRTLDDVVKHYIKYKYNKPGAAFIGLIHRLDRPVSGLVIYARTTKALSRMTNQFRYREVQKTYWAVVKNPPPKHEDVVINYMKKNPSQNKSYVKHKPTKDYKECELRYKVIGKSNHYTFLEIYPKTGRHHQIRATLADLGCPIKGDIKYGFNRTNKNASIHLHARRLEFVHPVKKVPVCILATPPEDPLWDEFLKSNYSISGN